MFTVLYRPNNLMTVFFIVKYNNVCSVLANTRPESVYR